MPVWAPHWLRDTRLLLFSQLLVVFTTTALAIMLARSLGPAEWGLFSALLALSLALSTFVNLGLGTWLLRDLSLLQHNEPVHTLRVETSRRVVGAVCVNGIAGAALLVITLVVLVVTRANPGTSVALLGLVAHTVFGGAAGCLEAVLRSRRMLWTVVTATLLERITLLVLAALAIAADYGIWAIGLAYMVGSVARFAFAAWKVLVEAGVALLVPTIEHLRRVVKSGLPFAFSTVAVNVIPRLDTVIIATVSVTAAGYFALGDRVLGPAQILPVVASSALYPFLAREAPGSRVAWRISGGMTAVGFVIALVGAATAPFFVPAVFGSSYEAAVGVVQVMFFVLPLVYLSNGLLTHLYTAGRERQVLVATLLASTLGTVAIVIGQLTAGVSGAAAGYVCRQVLFSAALVSIAYLVRTRDASLVDASPAANDAGVGSTD